MSRAREARHGVGQHVAEGGVDDLVGIEKQDPGLRGRGVEKKPVALPGGASVPGKLDDAGAEASRDLGEASEAREAGGEMGRLVLHGGSPRSRGDALRSLPRGRALARHCVIGRSGREKRLDSDGSGGGR